MGIKYFEGIKHSLENGFIWRVEWNVVVLYL